MKINIATTKKKAEIFGLLFLGYGTTISKFSLLIMMDSGENILVAVVKIVDFQCHLDDGNKNMEHSFVINF